MAKIQIKSETRHELSFFPNSFDDYVPKDSKVRMVDHIIRSMDINPLMDTYDGIGAPPYSPKMLLSLVVFAYINGVYSCRGIADALKYDVRYMWICGGKQLSFATINRFRSNHMIKCIDFYFDAVVSILVEKGVISLEEQYVDGTKIESKANKYTFVWKKTVEKNRAKLLEKTSAALAQIKKPRRLTAEKAEHAAIHAARGMMPAAGTETGGTFTLDMDAPSDMIETVRHMMDETGIPYHEEPSLDPGRSRFSMDERYTPAVKAMLDAHIQARDDIDQSMFPEWEALRKTARGIIDDDPDLKKKNRPVEPDWAATIAGRLNANLLDRVNGSVHDDWVGGILPPIRSRKHDAALDLVRQNERLIETRIDSLEQEARRTKQASGRPGTRRGRGLRQASPAQRRRLPRHVECGGRRQSARGEASCGKRQTGTALGQPQRPHQPHLHHGQDHENATHAGIPADTGPAARGTDDTGNRSRKDNDMACTIPGFLKTLTEWLVSVSRWFDGWDITILVPALIILTVIAGVTGRAAVGPRLWMQLVWGTVTVILGLIEVAIIWTIIARYLPVADMGTLIQNMLQRKPLLVTG